MRRATPLDRHVCVGAPFDSDGKFPRREHVNECPFPPKWACLGLYPGPNDGDMFGEVVNLLLLSCDLHVAPVMDVVSLWDQDCCLRVEIAGLPRILSELNGDYWTFTEDVQAA